MSLKWFEQSPWKKKTVGNNIPHRDNKEYDLKLHESLQK